MREEREVKKERVKMMRDITMDEIRLAFGEKTFSRGLEYSETLQKRYETEKQLTPFSFS